MQIELSESLVQFQKQEQQKGMDYLCKHDDYLDLKMEDNSDHYLFNSLLDPLRNEQDHYMDDLLLSLPSASPASPSLAPEQLIVTEVARYLNFRTTPMSEIIAYIEQFYPLPKASARPLYFAVRKLKLQLKRDSAKRRVELSSECQAIQSEAVVAPLQQVEIKAEDTGISPFLFEEESQETKKKKRNRMSAQNSRDRKKEYIRDIEKQNKELRKKVAELSEPANARSVRPQSKDFLKLLLCLGITCFVNLNQPACQNALQEYTQDEKASISSMDEDSTAKIAKIQPKDLEYYKKLLPQKNQEMLDQAIGQLEEEKRDQSWIAPPCIRIDLESENQVSSQVKSEQRKVGRRGRGRALGSSTP